MNRYFFAFVVILISCNRENVGDEIEWEYPVIKGDSVIDIYFGKQLIDEYRILENIDCTDVKNWIKHENEFYTETISNISGRDSLIKEIKKFEFSSNIRAAIPRASENKIFFRRLNIKESKGDLVCADLSGENEIQLFSTSQLKKIENGNYSIDYCEPSINGNFVVMGISSGGNEMSKIRILDVKERKFLSDSIERCMYGAPSWSQEHSGFFYNQLRELKDKNDVAMYERSSIKYHVVNTNPKKDLEIFSKSLNKDLKLDNIDFPNLMSFPSSDKVLVQVYPGSSYYSKFYFSRRSEVLKNPATAKWQQVSLVEDKVTGCALFGDILFLLKYKDNSNGQIELVDLKKSNDRKVIFEDRNLVLQEIIQNKKAVYIKFLRNGINGLMEIDPSNLQHKEIELPLKGSITLTGDGKSYLHSDRLYIGIESWSKEFGIYKYENGQFSLTGIRPQGEFGNPLNLTSKEVLVPSHDGILVPLSIIYPKDLEFNGDNPTILYGYGAYGSSIDPSYQVNLLSWFNRGGVYAVAHVRGGGEKGDQWYKDGYKATKANSWKDFIACAKYLISNKYTSPPKLAAMGASAGGITVGRAITEQPDLFKAAVITVGELNTIRSENSKNSLSVTELGTVKDSLEFKYLYDMDVYHHIERGVKYPSLLLTAALNDARVDPWQPAKPAAKMQQISKSNIVLFKMSDQGHYGDTDAEKETGEIYSFLFWQLGHSDFKYLLKE